jgi:hypothetical protein
MEIGLRKNNYKDNILEKRNEEQKWLMDIFNQIY